MRSVRLSLSLALGLSTTACVEEYLDVVLPEPVPEFDPSSEQPARILPPMVTAEQSPPPVSGGTMLVDDAVVVAAEPDRDRIQILFIQRDAERMPNLSLGATVPTAPGDEPGRVVAAGDGQYLVVLRGGAGVGRVERSGEAWGLTRLSVCPSPRGIDFDEARGLALVTCMDGRLMSLDPNTGETAVFQTLSDDLRDVVITEDRIFVTRFRTAEVIVMTREAPTVLSQRTIRSRAIRERQANVAYRMVALPDAPNAVVVSHQLSLTRTPVSTTEPGGYGGGARFDCSGALVSAGVTAVDAAGSTETVEHPNVVLPVDIAVSQVADTKNFRDARAALVSAGATAKDDSDGRFPQGFDAQVVPAVVPISSSSREPCNTRVLVDRREVQRTTSVAFTDDGFMVRQTQNPHKVIINGVDEVSLPGESTFDTGHELFFGDAGGGIACASCHAEGTDDAMVWNFETLGPRRTQEIRGGIMDTAPFHWDGEMTDFTHLTGDVMGERMSGPKLSDEMVRAMSRWIDSLQFPARPQPADMAAVERGRVIFQSPQAACATCHNDDRLGGTEAFDVGTGMVAHIPGLEGLATRAPFMHTGCAKTIRERFNPYCGGTSHGSVAHLDEAGIDDLVAYLESL